MKDLLLRALLIVDAAVLFALGAALIAAPHLVESAFHFAGLPESASYLTGSWGCALATMAFGYVAAARDPVRHVVWVQVGIARGALECAVGAWYLSRGVVTLAQIQNGLVIAAVVAIAYLVLYPTASTPGAGRRTAAATT